VSRSLRITIAVLLALVAAVLGLRSYLYVKTQHSGFDAHANGPGRPSDVGVPYQEFTFASGDRTLDAWWVPADSTAADSGALLIFHGASETISDWVKAVHLIHGHHLSCMVFDYSGFGSSTGEPSVDHVIEDGHAALAVFEQRAAHSPHACAVSLSLGTAVLMLCASDFHGRLDGVALLEPFASGREAAVLAKLLPAYLAPLMPDAFNSAAAAPRLGRPLLIVHSRADSTFPVSQAEKIFNAAREPRKLVVLDGFAHPDAMKKPSELYWAPVIAMAHGEALRQ
jgi:uncharacterized protein